MRPIAHYSGESQYTTRSEVQPVTDFPFDLSKPEPRDELVSVYTTKKVLGLLREKAEENEVSMAFLAHRILERALDTAPSHPRRRAGDAA